MAFDTVIDKAQLEAAMKTTADAIREKTGDTADCTWDSAQGFAALIAAIEAGGGAESGSFVPSSDSAEYAVEHGLGKVPDFFAVYGLAGSSSVAGGLHYAIGYEEQHTFGLASSSGSKGILGHFLSNASFTKTSLSITDFAALYKANSQSITITGEYSGAKLKTGIEYKWIAF